MAGEREKIPYSDDLLQALRERGISSPLECLGAVQEVAERSLGKKKQLVAVRVPHRTGEFALEVATQKQGSCPWSRQRLRLISYGGINPISARIRFREDGFEVSGIRGEGIEKRWATPLDYVQRIRAGMDGFFLNQGATVASVNPRTGYIDETMVWRKGKLSLADLVKIEREREEGR